MDRKITGIHTAHAPVFPITSELGTHRHVLQVTDNFSLRPYDQAAFVCDQISLEAPVYPQKTREFQFSLHPERLCHHRLGRLWKSKNAPARRFVQTSKEREKVFPLSLKTTNKKLKTSMRLL